MLENRCDNASQIPRATSWTIDGEFQEKERQRVVRTFINSAIYVEKEVTEMPPQRKTSPLSEAEYSIEIKGSKTSFSHNSLKLNPESGYRTMEHSSNSSAEQSENSYSSASTIKPLASFNEQKLNSEMRLSLTCLNTNRTCTLDPKERQEIVQNWMTKKEMEKKRRAIEEAKVARQKEEERQRLVEKERENFKKWLAEKKKEEERKRTQKEIEAEELKVKVAEKEKKKADNAVNFNLWVRRKKKDDLEKRIVEKLALLHMYEEKEKRMEENERAYRDWLENSKNRQKPVPPNKGLQSLCSSASVTYINPIPWTPNIDPNLKPASH